MSATSGRTLDELRDHGEIAQGTAFRTGLLLTRVRRASVAAILSVLCVGMLAGCGGDAPARSKAKADASQSPASSGPSTPPLQQSYDVCTGRYPAAASTLSVGDAGLTLIVDTGSEYGELDGVLCTFSQLETPESVTASVSSTTALMGTQEATTGGYHYSWSYHPDNGLNMVITEDKA